MRFIDGALVWRYLQTYAPSGTLRTQPQASSTCTNIGLSAVQVLTTWPPAARRYEHSVSILARFVGAVNAECRPVEASRLVSQRDVDHVLNHLNGEQHRVGEYHR